MLWRLMLRRCSPRRCVLLVLLACLVYLLTLAVASLSHRPGGKQSYSINNQIDVDPREQRLYRLMNPGSVLIHDKYMQMKRDVERHTSIKDTQIGADGSQDGRAADEKADPQEAPGAAANPASSANPPAGHPPRSSPSELNFPEPNYNMHAFYYVWYGNPQFDGKYLHWNHEYLAHWNKVEAQRWPKGQHNPPDDIGSSFYPELGPYSSRDPIVINNHMQQLRSAGIGTIAVSWYPAGQADSQGQAWDDLLPLLLDIAHKYQVKVCFHIEPFNNRNAATVRQAVMYIHDQYGSHPAYYHLEFRGRTLPLFYMYDSYLIRADQWSKLLSPEGDITVRNSPYDAVFVGLIVEERHQGDIIAAGFDGFYTYFASDGFTFGSSTRNWANLANSAKSRDLLFIPSVGPGYVDTQVRPWNGHNTRNREHGGYYEQSFRAAQGCRASIISITSFNEWHEGTQIEKAVPKQNGKFVYLDYAPQNPDYYLSITRKWALKFRKIKKSASL